jgi:hypothetical protein
MNKFHITDPKLIDDFSTANHDLCRDAVLSFCDSSLFADNEHRYENSYFGHRLRPHVVKHLNFSKTLQTKELYTYEAFVANRILFAMNEHDFLMLPDTEHWNEKDFLEFYSEDRAASAHVGMPYLERYLFSFLDDEIVLSNNWYIDSVVEYLTAYAQESKQLTSLPSSEAILSAQSPENAARDWLVQLALDFLIESSPMARYSSGNYGKLSSSLFKIIIDELGYGEFSKKHSTLFEECLCSVNINSTPHYYWQYYLNGSLLLANYYNYITRNRRFFFRYIGAIYLAETGFITSCKIWRDALKKALPSLDVRYFDEHCHIDIDHSRMVLDNLVKLAIEVYGCFAAKEIIRGFEEVKYISDHAEIDFVRQISWKNSVQINQDTYKKIFPRVFEAWQSGKVTKDNLDEPKGELSITHSHDGDELCHVVSREMEFLNGFETSTTLRDNEGIIIERNRLHGALIHSENCKYEIYNIGDINKWV